jgi:hypothetical protein
MNQLEITTTENNDSSEIAVKMNNVAERPRERNFIAPGGNVFFSEEVDEKKATRGVSDLQSCQNKMEGGEPLLFSSFPKEKPTPPQRK